MPSPTQLRGGRAEQRAVFFLQRHGYTIIARHVTSRFGEIDIICSQGSIIYLVEVKYRGEDERWPIEISMTEKKVSRMVLTWQSWTAKHQNYATSHPQCMWLLLTKTTIRQIIF